jgi:type I restriction enzyme S subunit
MEKQLIPQLRFQEFNDLYSKQEFSDLVIRVKKSYNPNKDLENFQCIELESLTQKTGQLLNTFDSKELKSNKTRFNKNDVLFGKLRPYLRKFWLAQFDGVCTSEIWVFKGRIISNPFLYYLIQTDKFNYEANVSSGSKMPRADWNYISSIKFAVPNSSNEQKKIASFLTAVDTKITQLTKKKALLEQYKKGVMQKIFKQEIRFKDANGNNYPEWVYVELGKLGLTLNGLTGKTKDDFGIGKPYIQYKQIFDSSKINIKNCGLVNISQNDKQTKVKHGDVFFTTSSETPNEIGTASVLLDEVDEMYLNSFCFGYRVDLNKLYPSFAQFLFRSEEFRRKMIPLAQGSTRYNISKSSFLKLKVQLPLIEEQTKIANFLSAIDKKVALVNTQLNTTKTFKKGLLQQLFV